MSEALRRLDLYCVVVSCIQVQVGAALLICGHGIHQSAVHFPKTVYVTAGETTLIEWKNIPITAQIQIVKKSSVLVMDTPVVRLLLVTSKRTI